eukprot:GHVR01180042.1.p1 GENE.GHVR01180042.1~~GHVR01180042.1.p1  ORF type:complete len:245 (+),score=74.08 GHVR01180042.1:17-751(+)
MLTGELILNTCFIVGIIYVLVSLWKKCMVSRKCVDISSDTPLHVSVCLNGTVIDEIKDNNVMMCEGQINSLKSLNNYFNVITITMVESNSEELAVRNALISEECGVLPHRLLFCSSERSKISIVRQLQPYVHIDSNSQIINELTGHVENLILVHAHKTSNTDVHAHTHTHTHTHNDQSSDAPSHSGVVSENSLSHTHIHTHTHTETHTIHKCIPQSGFVNFSECVDFLLLSLKCKLKRKLPRQG